MSDSELGYDTDEDGDEQVGEEQRDVVTVVLVADQEQYDGHDQQKLSGGRVQGLVVDLFPHSQVIVRPAVELKGCALDKVEHDVEPDDVGHVGQRPRPFGRGPGEQGVEDPQQHNDDDMNQPGAALVDPGRVHVGQHLLVVFVFERLRLHMRYHTGGASSPVVGHGSGHFTVLRGEWFEVGRHVGGERWLIDGQRFICKTIHDVWCSAILVFQAQTNHRQNVSYICVFMYLRIYI